MILREFDEIVDKACKIDIMDLYIQNDSYSDLVLRYRPNFTAARFCSLDKSTIFRVLESFTTFLLIAIQFKESA